MRDMPSLFKHAFHITNASLIYMLAIFMLGVISTSSSLSFLGWPLVLICIALKVLFYSGMLASLVEVISSQELVLTFPNLKKNIGHFWKFYFFLSLLPLFVHLVLTEWLSRQAIPMPQTFFILNFLVLYLFAGIVIRQKYLKPLRLPRRQIACTTKDFFALAALLFTSGFLVNIHLIFPQLPSFYFNVASFLYQYLEFFLFVYMSSLMISNYPEIIKAHTAEKELYLVSPLGGAVMEAIGSLFMRVYPPVFVVLKALSPKDYKVRSFNRITWREHYYARDKLVAVTCFTSNSPEAYKIAKEFKRRGSKVIMGGPHVTYHPDEALQFCDSVVIGEAESVWKEIVQDFENNALKGKYTGVPLDDFHSEVHQELLNSPPEIIKDFLETTRGCKFRCHFCTIPSLSGGKTRKKPVPELVELINKIKHKYKVINFIDNNIYSDPAYARELFKALKPLNIKWTTQCTIDIAKNEETLKLAKESGCAAFLFGYEIFGGSLEQQQGGKFALAESYIHFSRKIKDMGIKIKGHFIFGFDSDNFRNIFKLWKFCFDVQPLFTIISLLTPLPGSRLYHDMLQENRITNLNWRSYACHDLVFRHKGMNNFILKKVYPFILYAFFFTTSTAGFILAGLFIGWIIFISRNPNLPLT